MGNRPTVVVVDADPARDPWTVGDLIGDLAARSNYLPVRVRYGSRRPRLADFAADVLDALGRVGTQAAVRRTQSADLTLLVPFLLTDPTNTMVVFDAGWLGVDGVEDLIATAAIADHQLWLVLGEPPSTELEELLRSHCDPWLPLAEAANSWRRSPTTGRNAARLRTSVLTGRMTSEDARRSVVQGIAGLGPTRRQQLVDTYTRATVQPAINALHAVGITDERQLARLRIEQVTPDGAELQLADRTIAVPAHLGRALSRQRLHATVIGQRPDEQLLTYDGSVSNPSSLAWY